MWRIRCNKPTFDRHKEKAGKIFYCLFALLVMTLWAVQCGDDRDKIIVELPPGVIYGVVIDSSGNFPLEDAMLGADSVFDTTYSFFETSDSLGHYRYPTMDLDGRLYCAREGYLTKMSEYQTAHGESTRVDFELVPR